MNDPKESELIALIKKGGRDKEIGFRSLVKEYGPLLYRQIKFIVSNDSLTDDILQDVFTKVYLNIDSFKGESTLYTWLYRIARNEAINTLQKENRRTGIDLEESVIENISGKQEFGHLDGNKIQILLLQAIADLPEKQAIVFQLKYFEDLKYSEMSELLNTSEGALKANFFHAKEKISEFLQNALNQ